MHGSNLWTALSIVLLVAEAVAIVSVLRRPREPVAMLAWILALLLLPILGIAMYLVLGEPRFRRTRRRRHRVRKRIRPAIARKMDALDREHAQLSVQTNGDHFADLMALSTRIGHRFPTYGNQVEIYNEQERVFTDLVAAIESAKSHVHLEYYIFQPDETGKALRDLLVRKAKEGVTCRLLVDYIGCWKWPRGFRDTFVSGGVEVGFFLPVVPWRGRWRVNFRNHRKIAIIDGATGFTGSQNIGDEYRGRRRKYGPWRDTHLRIVGPAVHQLQEIFVEDWHYATGRDIVEVSCFPEPQRSGSHTVQVIASGPDSNANTMHHLLLSAVSAARKSVTVLTPYFSPDMTMNLALQNAAYRDVRVQLLIPSTSDNRVTLWAGRSYYRELASSGVEIYEYDHGMLHSKVVVVDDAWGMVGSANMDQRSFRINFEVTTLLYDRRLAELLSQDFEQLRYDARRVHAKSRDQWSFGESIQLGLARLVSPLL